MHTLPAAAAATLGALASTAAAAALLRAALHRYHLQQHSAALTVTTRLACGVAVLALQLQTPAVGDGAFATAAATVLHPEVGWRVGRVCAQLFHRQWKGVPGSRTNFQQDLE